jgi:hypothetical protein
MYCQHSDREKRLQDALKALAQSTEQEKAPDRVRDAVLGAFRNRRTLRKQPAGKPALHIAWAAVLAVLVPAAASWWSDAQLQPVPPVFMARQQEPAAELPPEEPLRFAVRQPGPPADAAETQPEIAVTDFLDLHYTGPASDSYQVVRVRMNRASLIQYGLPVNPEKTDPVDADLLIGEDGIPRAVRFVNNVMPVSYRP